MYFYYYHVPFVPELQQNISLLYFFIDISALGRVYIHRVHSRAPTRTHTHTHTHTHTEFIDGFIKKKSMMIQLHAWLVSDHAKCMNPGNEPYRS
jgi:hypothetical protein